MDMTILLVLTTGMLMQSSETTATDSIRDNLKILARNQDDHRILLQSLSSQVRDHGIRLTEVENRVMNVKQPTITPNSSDEWQVSINTGNHSCTDDILLQIRGDSFFSRQLRITLDTGATHTFIFDDIIDVGNVHSLRLELLGNDICFVGNITLRNALTKVQYTFNFYDFLDINQQVVIIYPDCPMGWIYLKASNICVKDIGRKGNYDSAVYECSENGGHLPEPHNYIENAQIAKFAGQGAFTWLGISEFVEGKWRYQSDNRSVKYANWATGRPLNWLNMMHCGVLVNDLDLFVTQGRWYDRSCLEIYPIMCSRVKDFNECLAKPCLHNGNCTNTVGSFTCDCQNTGYKGTLCEEDIDECLNSTEPTPACRHGGVCTNTNGSFQCNCTGTGYEGKTCEIDIDECLKGVDQEPACQHDGICTNTNGSFICDCTGTGYEGKTCENDVNECDSAQSPCLNKGICMNTIGNFTCKCDCGYGGPRCKIETGLFDVFGSGVCEWKIAFRGTKDINKSVYQAYMNRQTTSVEQGCRRPPSAKYTTQCTQHYRNNAVFDNFSNIDKVAFVVYKGNTRVQHVVFNAGSSTTDWFSQSNIYNSSWTDLKTTSKNFCSIAGSSRAKGTPWQHARRFFINHYYNGCPNDQGWFAASDMAGEVCDWAKYPTYPKFLYANQATEINWTSGKKGEADAIIVFVKYTTT